MKHDFYLFKHFACSFETNQQNDSANYQLLMVIVSRLHCYTSDYLLMEFWLLVIGNVVISKELTAEIIPNYFKSFYKSYDLYRFKSRPYIFSRIKNHAYLSFNHSISVYFHNISLSLI